MSNSSSYNAEQPCISLFVKDRADNSIELLMRAFREDFCACGIAFFSLVEINNFLSNLRDFPLNSEQFISGGYFDSTGNIIVSEHFHISVSQINKSGLLVMMVRAFTPHPEYWEKGFGFGGRCSYFLNYEDLGKFVDGFERIISGESSCFEFKNFSRIE